MENTSDGGGGGGGGVADRSSGGGFTKHKFGVSFELEETVHRVFFDGLSFEILARLSDLEYGSFFTFRFK